MMLVPSRRAKAMPAMAAALGVVSACRVDGTVRSGRDPSVTGPTVPPRYVGRLIHGGRQAHRRARHAPRHPARAHQATHKRLLDALLGAVDSKPAPVGATGSAPSTSTPVGD